MMQAHLVNFMSQMYTRPFFQESLVPSIGELYLLEVKIVELVSSLY